MNDKQKEYFIGLANRRFLWLTHNAYISQKEKELLRPVQEASFSRILEMGVGEGNNIVNLELDINKSFGIDLLPEYISSAKKYLKKANLLVGSCFQLPFKENSFDLVFFRDLLHHLDFGRIINIFEEALRVSRGSLIFIEANGKNPLIYLMGTLLKEERGVKKIDIKAINGFLSPYKSSYNIRITYKQPLPLFRLLLHYNYGFPNLGNYKLVSQILDKIEKLFHILIPRKQSAYIVVRIEKRRDNCQQLLGTCSCPF